MMSQSCQIKAVRRIAGAALVVIAAGVTGCSKGTDSGAHEKPTAGGPTASSASSATRESTAEDAVAAWVTAIVEGRPRQACLVMAFPATDASPARAGTPAMCDGNTPEVRKTLDTVGRLRTSFTPKGSTGDPQVTVAQVPVTGDRAVVPADRVTVDGQALDKVVLSHSTGLKPGQLDVKTESTRIDGAWYVTDFDLHIG
ncbi:hypothetical protein AB0D11_08980 [Streptomyces monashensis]|uniref:hypothetical protein n=1 Tax=Streptomyces monashensis TaxID=1678012 RepID=UPI0033CEFEAF